VSSQNEIIEVVRGDMDYGREIEIAGICLFTVMLQIFEAFTNFNFPLDMQ